MKKARPPAPVHDISIETPAGPYHGQWSCDAQRETGQIVVWSADGRRATQLGGHWPYPEALARLLLSEIARAAGKPH